MSFVLRMALRETRAAWKRLLFFFICLAIGVGAIVAHPVRHRQRPRRDDRRGPHAHRRRRRRVHRSCVVRCGPRRARSPAGQRPGGARPQRVGGYADDVAAGRRTEGRRADGGAARRGLGVPAVRRGAAAERREIQPRAARAERRPGAARAPHAAWRRRRRLHRDRPIDVRDSRRARQRAGATGRRLQPRPARAGRSRRARGRRASRVRQPREPPGDAEGGRAARGSRSARA